MCCGAWRAAADTRSQPSTEVAVRLGKADARAIHGRPRPRVTHSLGAGKETKIMASQSQIGREFLGESRPPVVRDGMMGDSFER
jgi:hypothetical protein